MSDTNFTLRISVEIDGQTAFRNYFITCKQEVDVQKVMSKLLSKLQPWTKEIDVELNLIEDEADELTQPQKENL